jgi:hypothetical protein
MAPGVITVDLSSQPPQTPLGIILAPLNSSSLSSPIQSKHTIVIGWTRPYNRLGLLQTSGMVRIGDRLVAINNVDVREWTFEKVISVLKCFGGNVKIKSLSFQVCLNNPEDCENSFSVADNGTARRKRFKWSVAAQKLYSFQSIVRNYRKHEICWMYEIHCRLFIRNQQGYEKEISWSVWKRFSEVDELHASLRQRYGWQLKSLNRGWGIKFPSYRITQSLLRGILHEGIAKERIKELKTYWDQLTLLSDLFDFGDPMNVPRYAKEMADFLDVERYLFAKSSNSSQDHLSNSLDNLEISTISVASDTPKKMEPSNGESLLLSEDKHQKEKMDSPATAKSASTTRHHHLKRQNWRNGTNKSAFQRKLLDDL